MNSTYLKFGAGALLFALWTLLVWTGHADPGLIDAIKFALGSLGLYHAATNLQGNEQLSMLMARLVPPAAAAPAASPAAAAAPSVEQIAEVLASVIQQPNVVVNVPTKPAPKEPA